MGTVRTRSTRWWGGGLATLSILWLINGCTSQQSAPPPVAATPTASSSAPTSPSSSRATKPSPTVSSTVEDAVTIDITISDGKVSPSGKKIDLAIGEKVILKVRSDVDDSIHAHGAGEGYELAVKAGKQATGSFVAGDPGRFVVEAHELEKVIAILNVR